MSERCPDCNSEVRICREHDIILYGPERFRISYMAEFRYCDYCGLRYMNWEAQKARLQVVEEWVKNRRKRGIE